MSNNRQEPVNYARLRIIQLIALSDAAAAFFLMLYFLKQLPPTDWVLVLIAFALASILFGAIFYFGCLLAVPQMKQYVLDDRTVIRGSSVDMVTDIAQTNDPRLNRWIGTYSFARSLFGLGIVPVVLLVGLYFFA